MAERVSDAKVALKDLQVETQYKYGLNLQGRIITMSGEIDEGWFDMVDSGMSLLEAESEEEPITIRLHSPGGLLFEAMAIVGRIKASKCHVVTEGYGEIMSACCLLLAAGDTRRLSKYAWFMWHEPNMGIASGTRMSEVVHSAKQLEKEWDRWCGWMAEFTGKEQAFWVKTGKHLDKYFTPDEAKDVGVVDEVVG